MKPRAKSALIIVGKFCLMVSALVGIVPLLVYVSLPVYILGVIIVVKSGMDKQKKAAWVLMPLAVIVFVWLVVWVTSLTGIL